MPCCAYSCTQYSLHTQYMLLNHASALLWLQLHTVGSPHTVHASNLYWCLAVPTAAHSKFSTHTVHASNPYWWLAVPTAAHRNISILPHLFASRSEPAYFSTLNNDVMHSSGQVYWISGGFTCTAVTSFRPNSQRNYSVQSFNISSHYGAQGNGSPLSLMTRAFCNMTP